MAEDRGKEEEKFDFTAEGEGYISLDEARVLAMRTAVDSPGDYGSQYQGVAMVFDIVEGTETDDHYIVILSFHPRDKFSGTPGQERFFVGKEGTIAVRQVLSPPGRKGVRFPVIPVAIGLVMVGAIAAVGAVFALGSSGGESVPIAVVAPTETPTPTETPVPAETLAQTDTPVVSEAPRPTPTPLTMVTPMSGVVLVSKWGTRGSGDGQFSAPEGVAVASDGSVYVTDTGNHRIQKFTSEGVFSSQWGTKGTGDGQFNYPDGVAVAPDGSVYVSDSRNNRIQKFSVVP